MELILINDEFEEIGAVYPSGDFEIGDSNASNDFELSGNYLNIGYGLYAEDTEVGGIIEYARYKAGDATTFRGWTWRGLLTQDIIVPPTGSDYMIVSGDANAVISSLIAGSDLLSDVFEVATESSGITVSNYQFNLYCTYLDGIMDMLDSVNAKLVIKASKSSEDKKVHITISAKTRGTISGNYNEDVRLPMTFTDDRMGINHLVCMGSGELQNRQRVDLYINNEGEISQSKYYTGMQERTEYYDYNNAESQQDLIDKGTEKLKTLASGTKLEISAESAELDIGDAVNGKYGSLSVSAPINKKIYKFGDDGLSIEYGVKEDS